MRRSGGWVRARLARGCASRDRPHPARPLRQGRPSARPPSARTPTRSRACGTLEQRRAAEITPRLGFSPTMLLSAAGTRPEPAVSVPSENGTSPRRQRPQSPSSTRPESALRRKHCAARRRASARRRGRWRTGRDWSCRWNGAGGTQARDARGVRFRRVGEGRTRRGGRQAGDVDVVLHGERHAVERQRGIALWRRALSPRRSRPLPRAP